VIKKLRGPNFRTKTSDDQSSELQEYKSKLDAISRSQAVIEFELDGTIIKANGNFLSALGYELSEIVGEHHRIFIDSVERQSPEYREFWPSLAGG
jgi:methyl-accepting chemotaxis protein